MSARPWPAIMAERLVDAARQMSAALQLDEGDDEQWIDRELWVTAYRAGHHLDGIKPTNVRDWRRRGLAVDEHGDDRSVMSDGKRWWPLADLYSAAEAVGRGARGGEVADVGDLDSHTSCQQVTCTRDASSVWVSLLGRL